MPRPVAIIALLICCLLLVPGCAEKKKYPLLADMIPQKEQAVDRVPTEEPPPEMLEQPKAPKELERLELPQYKTKTDPRQLPPAGEAAALNYEALTPVKKPVLINIEAMPLNEFISYGMAETLKVNVFMDEQVKNMKNPVTLRMTKEVPAPKALEAAVEIVKRYGLDVEERAGTLYIARPRPRAPGAAMQRPQDVTVGRAVADTGAPVLQIVPLKYVAAPAVLQLINEYFKMGVSTRELSKDTIILSGPGSGIKEILNFIEVVDVPFFRGKQIFSLRLTYWAPEDFIKQISSILGGLGIPIAPSIKDPGIYFIPVRFLNSVIFAVPDEQAFRLVIEWKTRLDTPKAAPTDEKVFTYRPRFSLASELVGSVRRLYGVATAPAAPAPGGQAQAAPQAVAAGPVRPGLRMSFDDRRNLVVISSNAATFGEMLALFDELDKPARQVLIEVTIAELTLKDDLKFGLEWFIQNRMYDGSYNLGTLFGSGATNPGLIYTFLSDSGRFRALLNAFAQKNLINILSSPRIMAIDNQEATIQVGTEVPIVTSEQSVQTTSVIQPQVLRNIQYRQTGVLLRVRPTINTEGALTLSISQEVSESQKNAYSSIDSPMILVRRMNTTVVGETGKSIILGGLMAETESEGESKVPFFGDIPILGYLFKTTSMNKTRTELIVIMTPVVLANTAEAVEITDEMTKALKWYYKGDWRQ